MSESDSYPKAEFFRKPNLSKNSPNGPKCGLNTRHDNREVTWSDSYIPIFNFSESRIFPNIYRMFRNVDWTHDMIIVKWHLFIFPTPRMFRKLCEVTLIHLFIWHKRKLCLWQMRHRFNPRIRVNDYQRYSMLTVLPLRSMSCTLGNSSSL